MNGKKSQSVKEIEYTEYTMIMDSAENEVGKDKATGESIFYDDIGQFISAHMIVYKDNKLETDSNIESKDWGRFFNKIISIYKGYLDEVMQIKGIDLSEIRKTYAIFMGEVIEYIKKERPHARTCAGDGICKNLEDKSEKLQNEKPNKSKSQRFAVCTDMSGESLYVFGYESKYRVVAVSALTSMLENYGYKITLIIKYQLPIGKLRKLGVNKSKVTELEKIEAKDIKVNDKIEMESTYMNKDMDGDKSRVTSIKEVMIPKTKKSNKVMHNQITLTEASNEIMVKDIFPMLDDLLENIDINSYYQLIEKLCDKSRVFLRNIIGVPEAYDYLLKLSDILRNKLK